MANVFQAASGYRDPLKAMTLKALEARAKAAAEATQNAMQPQTIATPMQGAAGMLDVLGAKMNQGRIDSAEAAGRADLAEAMQGINMDTGPDMATISRIAVRDPELAQHLYDQAMERRSKEGEQKFTASEHALDRQQRQSLQDQADRLKVSEDALQRGSTEKIATEQNQTSLATNAATVAGAKERELMSEGAASDLADKNNAARADQILKEHNARMTETDAAKEFAAEASGAYGKPGSPESLAIRDKNIAAANLKGTPGVVQTEMDKQLDINEAKQLATHQSSRDTALTNRADMDMLKSLLADPDAAGTNIINRTLQERFPILRQISPGGDRLTAINSIVKRIAPTLRAVGSGSTSDLEYNGMLDSLPKIGNDPVANQLITEMTIARNDIMIQRGNLVDQFRNGELKGGLPELRMKLQELGNKSIMSPQLRQMIEAVGGKIPTAAVGAGTGDDDLLNTQL